MQIAPTAGVIQHSISPEGIELTTIQARYWRPIHAEVMTHRVFSRNGRSSRAVPTKTLLAEPILEPLSYGTNQRGMTAGSELNGWRRLAARSLWLGMAQMTRLGVRGLFALGVHKQVANRPLEWFGAIDVLISTTNWRNWDALRNHPGAQPEIQALARAVMSCREASSPMAIGPGEWHVPYVERVRDRDGVLRYYDVETEDARVIPLSIDHARKLSVARCARLTYKPFDGAGDIEAEIARHDRLVVEQPVHASPAEHQATPDVEELDPERYETDGSGMSAMRWANPHLHGNLRGFIQYRKTLPNEWVPG